MPSTKDPTIPRGLLAIFKGDSGEGKSVAATSFPDPYVFDFDLKMPDVPLKHFPDKEIWWDTFTNIFQIEEKLNEFYNEGCPHETIIVDSITGLVNIVMNSVGEVKKESVPDLLKKVKGGAIEMMGIDYYSAEDRFCSYFVDKLKILWARPGNPRNVILTAHVVTVESAPDLKTKLITRTRSIVSKGKKFAAWLPTGFDNVYIFGRQIPDMDELDQRVKRICKTTAHGEDSAKCSYNFPDVIDFTNGSLYEKLVKFGLPTGQKRIGEEVLDAEIVS